QRRPHRPVTTRPAGPRPVAAARLAVARAVPARTLARHRPPPGTRRMSRTPLPPGLARGLRRWRRRTALPALLAFAAALALPWALYRFELSAWLVAAATAAIALGAVAWLIRHTRRHDATWLLRRLDAALPELEDSSDL